MSERHRGDGGASELVQAQKIDLGAAGEGGGEVLVRLGPRVTASLVPQSRLSARDRRINTMIPPDRLEQPLVRHRGERYRLSDRFRMSSVSAGEDPPTGGIPTAVDRT